MKKGLVFISFAFIFSFMFLLMITSFVSAQNTSNQTNQTCTNDCSSNGATQCGGYGSPNTGYQTCGNYDSDSCLEWSSLTLCSPGETCVAGACVPTCTNDCSPSGAKQCSGNGRQTCGNYDPDICLEWGSVTSCKFGCSNGNCTYIGSSIDNPVSQRIPAESNLGGGKSLTAPKGWTSTKAFDGTECFVKDQTSKRAKATARIVDLFSKE